MTKTFVICGATGKQGKAAVTALLKPGATPAKVRALVRNPDSAKAKEVAAQGAELVKGDLLDKASLVKAFVGADAVFIVTALEPFNAAGVANEIVQGQTAVAAAKEAKVPFVVLASVANSHLKTKIPHFDSKVIFEDDLKASGLAHCILKPACFMDNFLDESMEFKQGAVQFLIDPDGVPLPLVAVDDIGEFAALAMHKPQGTRRAWHSCCSLFLLFFSHALLLPTLT